MLKANSIFFGFKISTHRFPFVSECSIEMKDWKRAPNTTMSTQELDPTVTQTKSTYPSKSWTQIIESWTQIIDSWTQKVESWTQIIGS
jgi:hypothetical protein